MNIKYYPSQSQREYIYNAGDNQKYINFHRHVSSFPMSEAISLFHQQKDIGYNEMKNRYKQNYKKNIIFASGNAATWLGASMKEDEMITLIDNAIQESLSKEIIKGIQNINGYDLSTILTVAYEELDNIINEKDFTSFNFFLEHITQAATLMGENNNELMIALSQMKIHNRGDLAELNSLLNQYKTKVDGKKGATIQVSNSVLNSILNSLSNLASANFDDGNITKLKQSLQGYVKNIFSTQIGEFVGALILLGAGADGVKEIINALSGSDNVKLDLDEITKRIYELRGSRSLKKKTDIQKDHVSLKLEQNQGSVVFNLGVSAKWYKQMTPNSSVTFLNETSFSHRIDQMFHSARQKYLVYNSISLSSQDASGYEALKAAIIARNLDVMMSGLGVQGDFSQFIMINEDLYSIWEIIKNLENVYSLGGESEHSNTSSVITASASGAGAIISETNKAAASKHPSRQEAYQRIVRQNQAIKNISLTGHFYPSRLGYL